MPVASRFQAAVTALFPRNWRRLAVQATALSLVMPLAGAGPAAASAARSAHLVPRESQGAPEVTLARAPAALQVAVRRMVGSAALAGGPVQQAKLTASDGMPGEALGISVAISGSTAIVGADDATGRAGMTTGAAYVFVRTGTTWTQQAKLTAADGAESDQFGSAVALSGSTAVVAAFAANSGAGAAYVFVRTGTKWSQQAKLPAPKLAPNDLFGSSVAVSGDTAVVSTPRVNSSAGAVYVFVRTGTKWSRQAKLPALHLAANDYFGSSVAVCGSTAIVGAPGVHSSTGAAYVFVRAGTKWSQQAKLIAADGAAHDGLGVSVALSGSTAIAGASDRNIDTGAAYAFVRTGTAWSQRAELTAADATTRDYFGDSVAISGSTIVVGADFSNVGGKVNAGAAYVFARGSWAQEAKLTAADGGRGDGFGGSVAVTKATVASGPTVVAGAPGNKLNTGAAYVYVLPR